MYEGIDIESQGHTEVNEMEMLKTVENGEIDNNNNNDSSDCHLYKSGNDEEEEKQGSNRMKLKQTQINEYKPQNIIQNNPENYHTKIIPTIKGIIRENGILGLWQGQLGTFIREAIGSLIWFGTFQLLQRLFLYKITGSWDILDKDTEENSDYGDFNIPSWVVLVSGAIAGFVFNWSIFPVDTIKSVMQTEQLGFGDAINSIYRQYGFSGFYRGLVITLIRSIPSNAAIFYTYEQLTKLL